MAAWVRQIPAQVRKLGAGKASWYCEWDEPNGSRRCKSCGPGRTGKRNAERMRDHVNAELLTGTYKRDVRRTWAEFVAEYDQKVLQSPDRSAGGRKGVVGSLGHFGRLLKLKDKQLPFVTTAKVDEFKAARCKERGKLRGSLVSVATVNRDLRHVKAALRTAAEWGYLDTVPKFRFLREPEKFKRAVTEAHFADIYHACDRATEPAGLPFPAADWWRGLVTTAYMTGWRIGELLALTWADVDLEAATATTRARDNKGKRDAVVPLHPLVVEHVAKLRSFGPHVFPWDAPLSRLYDQFARIQTAAGIRLPCPDADDPRHGECSDACHRYGFHDERRAFATNNEGRVSADTLQKLMRHQSYATTQRYIQMAQKLHPALENLHVPTIAGRIG